MPHFVYSVTNCDNMYKMGWSVAKSVQDLEKFRQKSFFTYRPFSPFHSTERPKIRIIAPSQLFSPTSQPHENRYQCSLHFKGAGT